MGKLLAHMRIEAVERLRCKRIGADPFAYLREALERLPSHAADRLSELLPDAWFAAHPGARRRVAS